MSLNPPKNVDKDCGQEVCKSLRQLLMEMGMDPESASGIDDIRRKIALLESNSQLMKDDLAIAMHDLNNAFTYIMGMMGIYEDKMDKEDLEFMQESFLNIKNITRTMVAKCNSASGNIIENGAWFEMLNLSDFVEKIIKPFECIHSNIEFCVDVDDSHSTKFTKQILKQAIDNLILNSIKAIGDNNGKIVISANQLFIENSEMPEGMYTSISIEDNGCGIEKENIHRIFDSHFTTDKENGMGIGLRSVKKSVDQHSGYIFVDSSVEQNSFTRFTMFLPMSEMVSESQKKSSIPPTPILVINEDASISESLSRSISHFGGKCMAPDCSTDIVWLIANAPQSSVVILNNELSDQKEYGTNTARWIKNKRPDLSIFLSTIGACMDSATLKKEGVICGLFQRPFINPLIKGLSELQ